MRIGLVQYLLLACTLALVGCLWEDSAETPDYLPMDDSEYPYADVPRVVIETEDYHEIRDRETEIPSHFQMYGENSPMTSVLDLTVRGRGNSSFKMPKYGMKLEFTDKVSFFGLPASRDWALVGNFGDKTHLRNYMMTRLSEWLGAKYTPKCGYVELYLNREYKGLYLLSETVKVAKHRVNIPENDSSFLFEKETTKKLDPPFVTSSMGFSFHVKSPRNLTEESAEMLRQHLNRFESFMVRHRYGDGDSMWDWLDREDFLLYYWMQEYTMNEDGGFVRSIFMNWQKGGKIHFGPLWDFDLAFGNASYEQNKTPEKWHVRWVRWNGEIFRDSSVRVDAKEYWYANRDKFLAIIDSIPLYQKMISRAVKNEYKRWPVLKNTENWALKDPYDSYEEGVEYMVDWMKRRFDWLEKDMDEHP